MKELEILKNGMVDIIAIYQNFVNKIDDTIEIKQGEDYTASLEDWDIEIPLIVSESNTDKFMLSVRDMSYSNDLVNSIDASVWSFLHEVGHLQTRQGDLKSKVMRFLSHRLKSPLQDKIYYNIPEELNATEWAVNYVNLNWYEVKAFEQELLKAYETLYNKVLAEAV